MDRFLRAFVVIFVVMAVETVEARAQERVDRIGLRVLKESVLDPLVYVPAALNWTSTRLDWASSQPLFVEGYVETNPAFTVSGSPRDFPVSYGEGNRRIALNSLGFLGVSLATNAGIRASEDLLIDRFPRRRGLIKKLAFAARIVASGLQSYRSSSQHFEQWQKNKEMIARLQ